MLFRDTRPGRGWYRDSGKPTDFTPAGGEWSSFKVMNPHVNSPAVAAATPDPKSATPAEKPLTLAELSAWYAKHIKPLPRRKRYHTWSRYR